MKVSFAILCYNYGRYLAEAIESCLCQGAPRFETETLVIDDGSTDNTPEVCAQFGRRIRIIRGANTGFGASLAKGVLEAQGDYVCFLDADDYFDRKKLTAMASRLLQRIPLVIGGNRFMNENGDLLHGGIEAGGNTSTLCVRKDAAISLLPVENEISFYALYAAGHGVRVPDAITYYRYHDNSMTNRNLAGRWNTYLAGVTHRLADRMEVMSPDKAFWISSVRHAKAIAGKFRAQAFYNELEAALELARRSAAFKALWGMLTNEFLAGRWLSILALKMILRTIMLRPTFPKRREDCGEIRD